jgi:putative aldouronate transport system permease protein
MPYAKRSNPFDYLNTVLMILLCISMIYPFVYVVSISLSSPDAAAQPGLHLYPQGFQIDAYKGLMKDKHFILSYWNIIAVTAVGTFIGLLVSSSAAYTLSKKYYPYRTFFIFLLTLVMLFNGGLIPLYLVIKKVGLIDSWFALWLPALTGVFNVIILRNFFSSLPFEMEEAAKIDGASDFQVFLRIVLPLSKPVLATVALWLAVGLWNDWFSPYIFLNSPDKQTLPYVLRKYVIENDLSQMGSFTKAMTQANDRPSPRQLVATVITVAMVPMLAVYPFIQRYFVKGVILGSVKE